MDVVFKIGNICVSDLSKGQMTPSLKGSLEEKNPHLLPICSLNLWMSFHFKDNLFGVNTTLHFNSVINALQ